MANSVLSSSQIVTLMLITGETQAHAYRWRNGSAEKLSNLTEVTQPHCMTAEIQTPTEASVFVLSIPVPCGLGETELKVSCDEIRVISARSAPKLFALSSRESQGAPRKRRHVEGP